jgi:hypothetical protein
LTDSRTDDGCPGAVDAVPVCVRRISPLVSVIDTPAAHIIRYKWADPRVVLTFVYLPVFLVVAFITYVSHSSGANVPSPVGNFNILDYIAITIGAVSVSYFVAILSFNKTTTVITDTTFSVRRGPIPCPWPGNHLRAIDEVREISYVPRDTVNPYGFVTYTVFAAFKDGEAARLFFLLFERGGNQSPAVELADQVQAWVDEKMQARGGASSGPRSQKAIKITTTPISRAQRRKLVASVLTTLIMLASLMATAEYLAGRYRAVPQAKGMRRSGSFR